jgi:hypothetical protein
LIVCGCCADFTEDTAFAVFGAGEGLDLLEETLSAGEETFDGGEINGYV